MIVDPEYKIDSRWPEYAPPRSAVSELVQRPLYQIDADSIVCAYMQDWRKDRLKRSDR